MLPLYLDGTYIQDQQARKTLAPLLFFFLKPIMEQIRISQILRFLWYFKLQGKDWHNRSKITNTVSVLIASSSVQDFNTKWWWRTAVQPAFSAGFEEPLLSKTSENETWGLCMATSNSHLWSFPFFQHFFPYCDFSSHLPQSISSHFQTKANSVGIHYSCNFHGTAATLSAKLISHHLPLPLRRADWNKCSFKPIFTPAIANLLEETQTV